jgi:hypothetical protein
MFLKRRYPMASIQVLDLRSAGSDLLMDSEGFLDVLDNDLDSINGGFTPLSVVAIWGVEVATGYVVGAMASGAVVGGVVATRQ